MQAAEERRPRGPEGTKETRGFCSSPCLRVSVVIQLLLHRRRVVEHLIFVLVRELVRVEIKIPAAPADQLVVVALLDDLAIADDEDSVGGADRGEAMRDNKA